jgi:hypothetical protein
MLAQTFRCPHCGAHFELNDRNSSSETQVADLNLTGVSDYEDRVRAGVNPFRLVTKLYTCTVQSCGRSSIIFEVRTGYAEPKGTFPSESDHPTQISRRLIKRWQLFPEQKPHVREWPATVPSPIAEDYTEACLIRDVSPKASAALARRCLQAMIRDRYDISMARLNDEIAALKGRVDEPTWKAMDAVRIIGNIGAHPERDVSQIVNISQGDAALLLELLDRLIEEWYISGPAKQNLLDAIKQVADDLTTLRKNTKH